MAQNKITKAEMWTKIKAVPQVAEHADMVEFIDHELDLLRKKSENKKSSKTSEETLALKAKVFAAISDEVPMTTSDIIKSSPDLVGLNTQKITPIIKTLVNEDKTVERIEEKGKALFIKK